MICDRYTILTIFHSLYKQIIQLFYTWLLFITFRIFFTSMFRVTCTLHICIIILFISLQRYSPHSAYALILPIVSKGTATDPPFLFRVKSEIVKKKKSIGWKNYGGRKLLLLATLELLGPFLSEFPHVFWTNVPVRGESLAGVWLSWTVERRAAVWPRTVLRPELACSG